jgi:pilus assembly protein CpaE
LTSLESQTILELLTAHETVLGLLASPASPELGELITDEGYGLVLDALQGHYVYTVIDCQLALDDLTLTSLARADLVLVVLTPDVPS